MLVLQANEKYSASEARGVSADRGEDEHSGEEGKEEEKRTCFSPSLPSFQAFLKSKSPTTAVAALQT